MSDQNLGVISARAIAQLLVDNQEFNRLQLGKNNLGDEGVDAISQLVTLNKNYIDLDLASNNITERGVGILCEALQRNNSLISLSLKSFEGLNRNKLSTKGCEHLAKLLHKSKVTSG